MTDETKNFFNGPWTADRATRELAFVVKDGSGKEIVKSSSPDTVKRVARLPELYDALAELIEGTCDLCINYTGDKPKLLIEEILKFGCPAKSKTCHCIKKIELLGKVRGGK